MKMKGIIKIAFLYLSVAIIFIGCLALWYVIDDTSFCQKYEEANPNMNFEWSFSTGCIFELPDGTWINLREYKNQNEYRLEIENE